MKTFFHKLDERSRDAMIAFLKNHPRYDTMGGWNRATSYANCVKIHRLELTQEQMDKAWGMLGMAQVFDAINGVIYAWSASHNWEWQAQFHGRSAGYLVLYQGGLDYENAKTAQCDMCGKLTWHKENVPCTSNRCPGTLAVLEKPKPQIVTYPGRGVDMDEDFAEWSTDRLRKRVKLIREFDELCDECVATFLRYCDAYRIVEKSIMVPKTIKVLEPVPA